jgi:putative transcriptional regulator
VIYLRINLKKIREELGLTQEQVAESVGIARNTYTNIELGHKNPSFNVAINIKKVLGVEDDSIFINESVPKRNLKTVTN